MDNNYYNRLNATINFRETLKKIEEKKKDIIEFLENNMEECNHEILLTFGHQEDFRCYGVGEYFYCPFCSKKIIKYLKTGENFQNKHLLIDLSNLKIEKGTVKNIFPQIQYNLQNYLSKNPEANILEIKNFIYSLNINELIPKIKKFKK